MKRRFIRGIIARLLMMVLIAGFCLTPATEAEAEENYGPGMARETDASGETSGEGNAPEQSGMTGTSGQEGETGQADAGEMPVAPTIPVTAGYSAYFYGQGWGMTQGDNLRCTAPTGSYVTALKAATVNQPADLTGTIVYQANLSGQGWMNWIDNNEMAGAEGTDMPLEAVRVRLNGDLAKLYDVYTSVYQNGRWTAWVANGETAGAEGQGLRIDGLRISMVAKGSGEPPELQQVDPLRPMVALTFDDGPSSAVTPRVLDALESSGARATFFMVGNRVPGNASLVKRMVDLNCQVGNHTYAHTYLTKMTSDGIQASVGAANQNIANAGGVSPVVMRPPGGFYDAASLQTLGGMGMSAIMWSIDTRDWQTRSASKTVDAVLNHVKDGDIILMHDIYGTSADAAEVIIPELVKRGYQLVTVSELAEHRGGLAAGGRYSQFRP